MHIQNRSAWGRLALTLAMIVFLVGLATLDANAEQRRVIVNGQILSAEQLAMLDSLAGGAVPSGSYWIDPDTATWGFAGDPIPRGNLGIGRDPKAHLGCLPPHSKHGAFSASQSWRLRSQTAPGRAGGDDAP